MITSWSFQWTRWTLLFGLRWRRWVRWCCRCCTSRLLWSSWCWALGKCRLMSLRLGWSLSWGWSRPTFWYSLAYCCWSLAHWLRGRCWCRRLLWSVGLFFRVIAKSWGRCGILLGWDSWCARKGWSKVYIKGLVLFDEGFDEFHREFLFVFAL